MKVGNAFQLLFRNRLSEPDLESNPEPEEKKESAYVPFCNPMINTEENWPIILEEHSNYLKTKGQTCLKEYHFLEFEMPPYPRNEQVQQEAAVESRVEDQQLGDGMEMDM